MKIIMLTGKYGLCTMVSDEDFEKLNKYKWFAKKSQACNYVARSRRVGDKIITERMHRVVAMTPKGMDCDHIDCDPFNNQRENLRNVTRFQHNQRKRKH